MDDTSRRPAETIRMLFELDLADNPRLYEDLIRFKKGTKRINRLRLLAHEGLLAQHAAQSPRGLHRQPTGDASQPVAPSSLTAPVTAEVFGESIVDG